MRRITIGLSAALMLLAFAPAGALAQRDGRHHRHDRIERFAGTVKSFTNGVLMIKLRNGSTVRGRVNNETEVECMAPAQTQIMHDGRDGGGDLSSGDGSRGSSGDDNQAAQPNDNDAAEQNENEAAEPNDNDAAERNENEAAEPNDNDAAERNENEAEHSCSIANLTQGRVVREAELRISSTRHVWKKVELQP